jgi:hypothetical protein
VKQAIDVILYGGANIISTGATLGYKISTSLFVFSFVYEIETIKILLQSTTKALNGKLPVNIVLACSGIFNLYPAYHFPYLHILANFNAQAKQITKDLLELNFLLNKHIIIDYTKVQPDLQKVGFISNVYLYLFLLVIRASTRYPQASLPRAAHRANLCTLSLPQ